MVHFYYLDESGCTGNDLQNPEQPIFVLGGVSVRDEGWGQTQEAFHSAVQQYFQGDPPPGFELHAEQLLSPTGDGPFRDHARTRRNGFALAMLDLLERRSHHVHLVAIDKQRMDAAVCPVALRYDAKTPYLVAFDYMITHINELLSSGLGSSARGMIIFDTKDQFAIDLDRISHVRRFEGPRVHRIKRIVEFAYAADSFKNPMVQLSDLITFCTRKFLEVEGGYREPWPAEAKRFYASCFERLDQRRRRRALTARSEPAMAALNTFLESVFASPRRGWRTHYGLTAAIEVI